MRRRRVIDAHVHLPWRYRDPGEAASRLIAEMDRAGVELALVIAVEPGVENFRRSVAPRDVRKALGEAMDLVALSGVPGVEKLVYDTPGALREHERILVEHRRTTEEVVEAARRHPGRLLPVASICPDKSMEWNLERLRRLQGEIAGVKIYPTLHFLSPADKRLSRIYDWAAEARALVIVHTGCDPGVWELPRMCRLARPSLVAEAARRHRDTIFIVAHMGAYSALSPGIFFREALEAAALDNVYLDTAAVDPFFVERAVEEVGYEKILFGSDYPYLTGLGILDAIRALERLGLEERVLEAILYWNARRLLRSLGRLA